MLPCTANFFSDRETLLTNSKIAMRGHSPKFLLLELSHESPEVLRLCRVILQTPSSHIMNRDRRALDVAHPLVSCQTPVLKGCCNCPQSPH